MQPIAVRVLMTCLACASLLPPVAAQADVRAAIIASHDAVAERGRFRVVSEIRSGKERTTTTASVVWPDRYHLVTQHGSGETMEVVIVPGGSYMKQDGQWLRFPIDMGAMIKAFTPDAMRESRENMTDLEDLGSETINGRLARKYRYTTSGRMMGIRSTSTVTLWTDAETRLPIRQEVEGEAMGQASTTVQTYTFDDDIVVDAPR